MAPKNKKGTMNIKWLSKDTTYIYYTRGKIIDKKKTLTKYDPISRKRCEFSPSKA
jgi:hypothetical protein